MLLDVVGPEGRIIDTLIKTIKIFFFGTRKTLKLNSLAQKSIFLLFLNVHLVIYCHCMKWTHGGLNNFLLKFIATPEYGPLP